MRLLCAGIGAFILLLALGPVAEANRYVVRQCVNGQASPDLWAALPGAGAIAGSFYVAQDCSAAFGGGIGFTTQGPVSTPSTLPQGTQVAWQFIAPVATRVVAVGGTAFYQPGPYGRQFGAQIWNPASGTMLATIPEGATPSWVPMNAEIAPATRVATGLRCLRPGGCVIGNLAIGPSMSERMVLNGAVVTLEDSTPPEVAGTANTSPEWRSRGTDAFRFEATDNVGVKQLRIDVDGRELAASRVPCYDAASNLQSRPCSGMNSVVSADVPLDSLPNGRHIVTVEARDPSELTSTRTFVVRVDRAAPGAPRDARVTGTDGWRRENRFELTWARPPESDETAPIVGNRYEFCPASNAAYDSTSCVPSASTYDAGRASDLVTVPGEGAWQLRVAHRDAAGNSDVTNSAAVEPLKFDATPPVGAFEAFDPRDPTRIRLRASDAVSGVARVEIEARRDGEAVWHALIVEGGNGQYSAVLDDALYPTGSYELRARMFDRAENETSAVSAPGGAAMRMALPVRIETQMTAGRAKRVRNNKRGRPKYKQVLEVRPLVDFGTTVTVTGKITDPGGNPRPRVAVDVFEQIDVPARPWKAIGAAQTTTNGAFTYRVPAGTSRTLRFSYAGSPTTQPVSKEVEVRVRAAATITPDRRVLRNGDEVVFRGHVRSAPIPKTGKLVTLQALTRRGWTTFGNARARARDGRWTYRYRFTGTTVRSRYTFRVLVPTEAGYPYAQGVSARTRVLVSP